MSVVRSHGGVHCAMSAVNTGKKTPEPRPFRKRRMKKVQCAELRPTSCASGGCRRVHAVDSEMDASITRFGPKLVAMNEAGSCEIR